MGTPSLLSNLQRAVNMIAPSSTGCWLWTGAIAKHNGYGRFSTWKPARKHYMAHRFIWEELNGPVPDGLELDHTCRVRSCVNPDHLEPVTQKENARRKRLALCKRGHVMVWRSQWSPPRGACRECGGVRVTAKAERKG